MATRVADLVVPPDRVMVDTNVLLAATDESRTEHRDALTILNDWPAGARPCASSGQILREYLPSRLGPSTERSRPRSCRRRWATCAPSASAPPSWRRAHKVAERLLGLLADVEAGGKQVHDANVVATMLVHGIAVFVTMNLDDFARFGQYVDLLRL